MQGFWCLRLAQYPYKEDESLVGGFMSAAIGAPMIDEMW